MKPLNDIENLLKESRLPDRDMSPTRHEVWHRILERHRDRRRFGPLFRIRPAVWALMSILLVVLCLIIIFVVMRPR